MWYYNKKINSIFTSYHSKNCWANVDTIGWRKIKPSTTDGTTNLFIMMRVAKTNNKTVSIELDSANEIITAYLN